MNPHILFWIPAALRIGFIWIVGAALWYYLGSAIAMTFSLLAMTGLVVMQLYYLSRLDVWLDSPMSEKLPSGWGAWSEICNRLYQLHRDQEKSREELTEWLARFRQAMNGLPDGVLIVHDVLFLEWCNPAAERHLGISLENDKGSRLTNLVRNPDFIDYMILARYDSPLTMIIDERKLVLQVISFENRRQILVTHDMTQEEHIAKMRRDFVANASHELRTPLAVINSFLQVAEEQPDLDRETRISHVRMMREQGDRMQLLVDSMLTLTRLESTEHPEREPIEVIPLIEQAAEYAKTFSEGRHTINVHLDGPDTIYGSADEVKTAFTNLTRNAVRYTPEGGTIDIHWDNTPEGPRFRVHDTGIGIEARHIPRLTQRFYLVDKNKSRKERGTGLGLAITRHVMLRHKGQLNIESEVGKGSVFTAQFPKNATLK